MWDLHALEHVLVAASRWLQSARASEALLDVRSMLLPPAPDAQSPVVQLKNMPGCPLLPMHRGACLPLQGLHLHPPQQLSLQRLPLQHPLPPLWLRRRPAAQTTLTTRLLETTPRRCRFSLAARRRRRRDCRFVPWTS